MFICRLRLLLVFSVFLFILGPEEGTNQMGKQKKNPETFVSYGFGFGSDFQTEEKKREFSFCMNIQLEYKAIFVFLLKGENANSRLNLTLDSAHLEKLLDSPTSPQSDLQLQRL